MYKDWIKRLRICPGRPNSGEIYSCLEPVMGSMFTFYVINWDQWELVTKLSQLLLPRLLYQCDRCCHPNSCTLSPLGGVSTRWCIAHWKSCILELLGGCESFAIQSVASFLNFDLTLFLVVVKMEVFGTYYTPLPNNQMSAPTFRMVTSSKIQCAMHCDQTEGCLVTSVTETGNTFVCNIITDSSGGNRLLEQSGSTIYFQDKI